MLQIFSENMLVPGDRLRVTELAVGQMVDMALSSCPYSPGKPAIVKTLWDDG